MEIKPKNGIDKLLFGMEQKDVEALYGKPDRQFADDDKNVISVYNAQRWRLTYYEDEDFRLGYIISSNPELTLFAKKVIGRPVADVVNELSRQQFTTWEQENFDLAENHFNEENWLILQAEFGSIAKIEMGAIINDKDAFEWKFGKR